MGEFYTPYAEAHVNLLYNLLFCDDLALSRSDEAVHNNPVWAKLLDEKPNYAALERIGRARYLNQSGKVAIFEGGPPPVEALARELVTASQSLVNAIGPWQGKRLPPHLRAMPVLPSWSLMDCILERVHSKHYSKTRWEDQFWRKRLSYFWR